MRICFLGKHLGIKYECLCCLRLPNNGFLSPPCVSYLVPPCLLHHHKADIFWPEQSFTGWASHAAGLHHVGLFQTSQSFASYIMHMLIWDKHNFTMCVVIRLVTDSRLLHRGWHLFIFILSSQYEYRTIECESKAHLLIYYKRQQNVQNVKRTFKIMWFLILFQGGNPLIYLLS